MDKNKTATKTKNKLTPSNTHITCGYVPGALGRIVALHADYYHRHWGFGLHFEALVATDMAAFLRGLHPQDDAIWLAWQGDTLLGAISVAGAQQQDTSPKETIARIRWFILAEEAQGLGLGKQLMQEAMDFCRERGFAKVFLTTFAGLDAARALYEAHGFKLTETHTDKTWGVPVQEQRFDWSA